MDAVTPPADELQAWLALLRLPGVGPRTLGPLLQACPDPRQLLNAPPMHAPETVRRALREADLEQAAQDARWLQDSGNQLLPLSSPHYPELLRALPDPPLALFLRGDPRLLLAPQVAVVGSRSATRGGLENAHDFSRSLAAAGITICSGLALGVDSAAHEGALDTPGSTVAVLGTGLDRVYPARHRELAHRIAAQGLLVSEYPPGTAPLPHNFPRRNL